MIRAGAFKIRAMEKAIFEEGQHVITPAGAGQIIHKSAGGKWTVDTGGIWEDYPQDEIVSAILLSPEPANKWDFHAAPAWELACMRFSEIPDAAYCHHCGWEGLEMSAIHAAPDVILCPNCEVRLP